MHRLFPAVVLAALVGAGCQSSKPFGDIRVETETNPRVNLSGYRTYAWAAAAAAVRDPDRRWTAPSIDVGSEIVYLVNRELRAKGMTEVAASPDVLAIYAVGVDMEALNVVTDADGTERFENVPQGGLLVLLADPATRQVTWAGSAVADIQQKATDEERKQRLDYAVRTMFKDFRPR